MKNEQRRATENDIYHKHLTKLNRYLSQHTYILKANVQDNMSYVERFKSRNAEFRARMRAEIERCNAKTTYPAQSRTLFSKGWKRRFICISSRLKKNGESNRRMVE